MSPRDVAAMVRDQASVRVAVAIAWALLSRPAARRQLFPPGGAFIRSAPIARAWQWATCAPFVLAAELPPIALVMAGGQVAQALRLGFACVVLALASRDALSWAVAGLSLLALALPLPTPWVLATALVLAPASALVLGREHARAVATIALRSVRLPRLPAIGQLLLQHGRALGRTRPISVAQAALAVALGWAWLRRWIAEHARVEASTVLGAAAVVTLVSAAPWVGLVGRVHRTLAPWIRATATPLRLAVAAAILVLATPSLAFAAAIGATSHSSIGLATAGGAGAYGLSLCAVAFRLEAWTSAVRRDARALQVMLLIGGLALAVMLAQMPGWAVAVAGVAFVIGSALSEPRESTHASGT